MKNVVVTVTGPTASGKTKLVEILTEDFDFEKLVSVTTRPKRPGEVYGKDYYFINQDTFDYLVQQEDIAQSVCFRGCNYATTITELERVFKLGKTPIVIVEPGGVDQFKEVGEKNNFEVFSIFINAPYELLEHRYMSRLQGRELTDHDVERLEKIKEEHDTWEQTQEWDYTMNNGSDSIEVLCWLANNASTIVDKFKEQNDSQS